MKTTSRPSSSADSAKSCKTPDFPEPGQPTITKDPVSLASTDNFGSKSIDSHFGLADRDSRVVSKIANGFSRVIPEFADVFFITRWALQLDSRLFEHCPQASFVDTRSAL